MFAGAPSRSFRGSYSSSDGGGVFNCETEQELPWVITEGVW